MPIFHIKIARGARIVASFRAGALASSVLLLAGVGNPAVAQENKSKPQTASEQPTIEQVVVTARRRTENPQQVPLSISVFSPQQLTNRGNDSLNDIAQLTPGLNFASYSTGGYPVITMRGLAQRAITAFEENVSTFYGGIYLPRAYMVDTGTFSLERVEVVKGPQSALYGRNAFSGAINFVPISPPDSPSASLVATVGTNDRYDYGIRFGGPLLDGKVRAIFGYKRSMFDGTWKNPHPNAGIDEGGTTGNMGGWDNSTYFVGIAADPLPNAHITFNWIRSDRDLEDAGRYNISRNTDDTNCDSVGGIYQFYCGELPVMQPNVDPRSQGLHATSDVFRVKADYQLTPTLSFHYLFGHIYSSAYSFDQTSINSVNGDIFLGVLFLGLPIGSISADSHEFRVEYDSANTHASAGIFYGSTDDNNIVSLVFAPPLGTTPLTPSTPGQIIISNDETKIQTRSIYGQVSQDLFSHQITLEAEARYTEEKKADDNLLASQIYRAKFDYLTPRFSAKWNITPNNNIYISGARGVKAGGFNGGDVLPSERSYGPEKNWTYEIGTKNTFFDHRLLANFDFFYVDWTDLQTVSTSGNPSFVGTVTRNVGTVHDYGVELELYGEITDHLTGSLSFAYTNPKYGKGLTDPRFLLMKTASGDPEIICNGITCPADGSIGGNILAVQSQYEGVFGLDYSDTLPIWGSIRYTVGGDVDYRSKQYVDPLDLTWVPSRTLVNLHAQFTRGQFEVDMFVTNLFDEKYTSGAVYTLAPSTNVRYEVNLGQRRAAGITLRWNY